MKSVRKHKKINSLIAFLLIGLLVCGCLAGCGSDGREDDSAQMSAAQDNGAAARKAEREKKIKAAKERAAKREAAKKKKKEAEKKSEEAKNSDENSKGSSSAASDKSSSGDSSGKQSSSKGKSSGSSKSGSGKSSGKSSSAGSGGGGGSGGSSSSGQQKHKASCTISVTCHKLVGNDDIDRATKASVPSSGVLISNMKVEIRSGDSVYDILKRACDQRGIVVAAENTGFGIYVAGIGGLYEKAAGGESGWKYKVNGSYPNDSAGDVRVSDGDVIEWVYVLEA